MKKAGKKLNVLIVDDHKVVRLGLIKMLENITSIDLVDQATNGREALERLRKHSYDFVFMDIKMPMMDGITATSIITNTYPKVNVVALSVYDNDENIKAMFVSGAKGYLLKNTEQQEIENAINKILKGKLYASPGITDALITRLGSTNYIEKHDIKLTERERDVLYYLSQGLTSNAIADKLLLSKKSIDLCRSQLLDKTKCKNATELVIFALDNHLIKR